MKSLNLNASWIYWLQHATTLNESAHMINILAQLKTHKFSYFLVNQDNSVLQRNMAAMIIAVGEQQRVKYTDKMVVMWLTVHQEA